MPKIDVTTIEGYDTMSPEQKIAALEAYEYQDYSADVERYKNAASKANSEAAEWKKKHHTLLSEEEQKQAEAEEKNKAILAELESLRKTQAISDYRSKLLALGYDEAIAEEVATAMQAGDTDKIFAGQKKFLEKHEAKLRADLLAKTPTPAPGGKDEPSKEDFKKMSLNEKQKLYTEHPELYKKLQEG